MQLFLVGSMLLFFLGSVSAGIGIKWDKESALISEGEKACMTYAVYNPWNDETYATIGLSEELLEILTLQEVEAKVIPAQTSSAEAIPIEFCFEAPDVYQRDCLVGSFVCEQTCSEEQKMYEGEVVVSTLPNPNVIEGTGGSSTQMSVSAPLRIRISCTPHARDYTLVYVLLAIISALVIGWVLFSKYRKPKAVRDREKFEKLKAELSKSKKKAKKKKK